MKRGLDWLVLLGWGLIIMILVRPGSLGPQLVKNLFSGAAQLTTATEGGAYWAAPKATTRKR